LSLDILALLEGGQGAGQGYQRPYSGAEAVVAEAEVVVPRASAAVAVRAVVVGALQGNRAVDGED